MEINTFHTLDCNQHIIENNCKNLKYFSQNCVEEIIELPTCLPDIEQIISVVVECDIISLKTVDTMIGTSYEGQKLSGKKIAVEMKLKQKILYVSNKSNQSVHILENDFYHSAYIVIPCLIEGTEPEYLIKHKILQCKVDIEDVAVRKIDKCKLHKSISYIIRTELSPTYEICYSAHNACNYSDVFTGHLNGSNNCQISQTKKSKNYKPIWSPIGNEIAFISEIDCKMNFNIVSIRTLYARQITLNEEIKGVGSYCWTKDGTKIFFSGRTKTSKDIFKICTKSMSISPLTNSDGMFDNFSPKCSPCGQKIAYLKSISGLIDIWIMDTEGLNSYRLTNCGNINSFEWCPKDNGIVYICKKSGNDHIYYCDIEIKKHEEIVIEMPISQKKKCNFSPDGTFLSFISSSFDTEDLYVYNLQENKLENISKNFENTKIFDCVWSADSDRIYFSSNELFYCNIYMIHIENKQRYQLTNTTASKIELSYRPRIG